MPNDSGYVGGPALRQPLDEIPGGGAAGDGFRIRDAGPGVEVFVCACVAADQGVADWERSRLRIIRRRGGPEAGHEKRTRGSAASPFD